MTFSEGIDAFKAQALVEASTSINSFVKDYFSKIVELSPDSSKGTYSIGTIKDNWYSSIGIPSMSFGNTHDDVGASSLMRLYSTLEAQPFLSKDNTVYFSNSTPWAYRAEYLGWASNDPTNDTGWVWRNGILPYAMVRGATTYIGKYL